MKTFKSFNVGCFNYVLAKFANIFDASPFLMVKNTTSAKHTWASENTLTRGLSQTCTWLDKNFNSFLECVVDSALFGKARRPY